MKTKDKINLIHKALYADIPNLKNRMTQIEKSFEFYEERIKKAQEILQKTKIGCETCYGKGYSTEARVIVSGRIQKPIILIHLCRCQRGQDLKKYFEIKKHNKI